MFLRIDTPHFTTSNGLQIRPGFLRVRLPPTFDTVRVTPQRYCLLANERQLVELSTESRGHDHDASLRINKPIVEQYWKSEY